LPAVWNFISTPKEMDAENTGRWSWRYAILKFVIRISFFMFYRNVHVSGREHIPEGGKLIFAANHQNALMDALAVILTNKYQPVYLARADIFKKPFIAGILRILKIIPVYRIRDGMGTMGNNEDTFQHAATILASDGCIGIMPEGNNSSRKQLGMLKKGIFRIAFRAEQEHNNRLGVKIVPVGIDYNDPSEFFGRLVVNYGRPVPVEEYFELHAQHPQKGMVEIKKEVAGNISSLMLDIKDGDNYETDKHIIDIGGPLLDSRINCKSGNQERKSLINRAICSSMYEYFETEPSRAAELRSKISGFLELIRPHGIPHDATEKIGKKNIFLLLVIKMLCIPVFVTGFLLHIFPVIAIHSALKKNRDPQFTGSFKFVLGTILVPLNYLITAMLLLLFISFPNAVLFIALMPLTGFLGYICYRHSISLNKKIHFHGLCSQDKEFESIIATLKSDIIEKVDPIILIAEKKLT
jgi:1-acyl-sn-glycerol-3-phosphate acyltransferase